MKDQALRLALEALECALSDDKPYIDKCNRAITTIKQALAEQPAQQEPKIDIYRSFEQWKSGNVLEHGVPRTEHYSEAQLDLVEMGWNYGYDAGRAVEQALDKKADNARELGLDYEPEPVAWMYVNKDGECEQIEHIEFEAIPDDPSITPLYTTPPKREPLTDEVIEDEWERITGHSIFGGDRAEGRAMYISPNEVAEFARAIEAAHGIKGEA